MVTTNTGSGRAEQVDKQCVRIGGASGYWGDWQGATSQLLGEGNLDFIVYDYLAEITMSLLARARAKNAKAGYAADFVSSAMGPNLDTIAKQGVRIISNAGGVNPLGCAQALEKLIVDRGLSLRVACISGDDLLDRAKEFGDRNIVGMFGGDKFPEPDLIASINVYIGAFAIAQALDMGADIVVVGRCVDSAVTVGACIHAFGWKVDDYHQLASASLAGHIIECGAQATGGNFTDWMAGAHDMADIGYPIVEIESDGAIAVSKPQNTGGIVSLGSVGEQIVYEIGDPQNYLLPDVTCDFSQVQTIQADGAIVEVRGAMGRPPPKRLKAMATWHDGFRGGQVLMFYGFEADKKTSMFAQVAIERARKVLSDQNLGDFTKTDFEIFGASGQYEPQSTAKYSREVCVKIAARHESEAGISVLLREISGLALGGPPGIGGFTGTRPRPLSDYRVFQFPSTAR